MPHSPIRVVLVVVVNRFLRTISFCLVGFHDHMEPIILVNFSLFMEIITILDFLKVFSIVMICCFKFKSEFHQVT